MCWLLVWHPVHGRSFAVCIRTLILSGYLVGKVMLCASQMIHHPCFLLNRVSFACCGITIIREVSLCVFGGLCVFWLLLSLAVLVWVLCGQSTVLYRLHPVWMISIVQCSICSDIGVCDVLVGNTGIQGLSINHIGELNSSPTMLHHPLDCCLGCSHCLVLWQSDGTLSIRRVGCRSCGFGVGYG